MVSGRSYSERRSRVAAAGAVDGRAGLAERDGDAAAGAARRAGDERDPPSSGGSARSSPRRARITSWAAVTTGVTAKPRRRARSGATSAIRAPAIAVATETSPMIVASVQRTVPSRVWRHEPSIATGMIASSEVASACSWLRPSTRVRVGTKMVPPPTPNRPATMPAATPRAMIRTRLDDHASTM